MPVYPWYCENYKEQIVKLDYYEIVEKCPYCGSRAVKRKEHEGEGK